MFNLRVKIIENVTNHIIKDCICIGLKSSLQGTDRDSLRKFCEDQYIYMQINLYLFYTLFLFIFTKNRFLSMLVILHVLSGYLYLIETRLSICPIVLHRFHTTCVSMLWMNKWKLDFTIPPPPPKKKGKKIIKRYNKIEQIHKAIWRWSLQVPPYSLDTKWYSIISSFIIMCTFYSWMLRSTLPRIFTDVPMQAYVYCAIFTTRSCLVDTLKNDYHISHEQTMLRPW